MDAIIIVVLLILGGLIIFSGIKGAISLATGRGEPPKNLEGYVRAAVRGRDPMKGPTSPVWVTIISYIWKLFVWFVWLPDFLWKLFKFPKWAVKPCTILFWIVVVLLSIHL